MRVAVVDYGSGNLASASRALAAAAEREGLVADVQVTRDPDWVAAADRVVLPGQGAMRDCMDSLRASGAEEALRRAVATRPVMGVCVGEQMLFDESEENGGTPGLGLLPGKVLMQGRLAGLGAQGVSTDAGVLRGHTFHYSLLETDVAPLAHTVKHPSGAQGEAVYRAGSLTASYFHAFFASNPDAAARLLGARP